MYSGEGNDFWKNWRVAIENFDFTVLLLLSVRFPIMMNFLRLFLLLILSDRVTLKLERVCGVAIPETEDIINISP